MLLEALISRDELLHAFERVEENSGCAGTDGVTVGQFASRRDREFARLERRLEDGSYRPYPLLKIVIQKKPNSPKMRTLLVPTVADRVLQTAAARQLSRSFEEEFLECSFGYRPGRSVDRAIARVRKCQEMGYRYVVDADIHSFFDEVDHDQLLSRLARHVRASLMPLLRLWVAADIWDGSHVVPLKKGVPQGSPISPLLANFFLEEFDAVLEASGRKLVRYADDFLILARTPDEAQASLTQTAGLLGEMHLRLAPEKTRVTSFEEGFHFLGAYFQNESIWIPWKAQRKMGKVLYMAKPLPAALRARYEAAAPPRTAMQLAFTQAEGQARAFARALKQLEGPRVRQPRSMPFLYLTDQGAVLRKAGDRFLIERDDEVLRDLPYHKLETVIVFGNVQVTTQALGEMLEKGIALHFLSRQGDYKGSLLPPRGAQVLLRLAQFEAYRDRPLDWARGFVAAKLANAVAVLDRYRHQEAPAAVVDFDARRAAIRETLGKVPQAVGTSELMGYEGSAAKEYFGALMMFQKSPFPWEGRRMHPSPDPLNALLSLTYTLLTGELTALLEATGLDPYLGFLHGVDYNRPSLALDVIEPFRHPLADRFVLTLVNKQILTPEDFRQEKERPGIFLAPTSLKRYLMEYEKWMLTPFPVPVAAGADPSLSTGERSWRQLLREETQRLAHCLRENEPFTPYLTSTGASGVSGASGAGAQETEKV